MPEKRSGIAGPFSFVALHHWVVAPNLVPYGLFGDVTLPLTER
ncbi:MAG: hypothetical protein ABSD48_11765 [Armatimonadota bacterium]|jgi:hypothetical protein